MREALKYLWDLLFTKKWEKEMTPEAIEERGASIFVGGLALTPRQAKRNMDEFLSKHGNPK